MAPAVKSDQRGIRAVKAAGTRRRMVEAAVELFTQQGYSTTTMGTIAARAGVAVQTLYFSFGNKRGLLQHAFAESVMGPDALPPPAQPWHQRMLRARTVDAALAHAVEGATSIFTRVAPLVAAIRTTAGGEAAEVWAQQHAMRRAGFAADLDVLIAKQPLRAGMSKDRALTTMLTVLSPDAFTAYTVDEGRSVPQFQDWAHNLLLRDLFG